MTKTALYKTIAAALREDLGAGRYGAGDRLPSEAELAKRFGVNRHTVRHALAALAEDGLVVSRRGAGTFVLREPTVYPIGRRVRFHRNLEAAGRHPQKKVLQIELRAATEEEKNRLGGAEQVCLYRGISLADGQPVALFESAFSDVRMADALQENSSVTAGLKQLGVPDYVRVLTHISAVPADPVQGLHLNVPEGAPLIYALSVNADLEGRPVEFGRTWFAGDRITLTLEADQGS